MALFNEILVGRYNRFLQKFLGIKGGPPAPQLASEMMAVWPLFHGAENRYLEGWERFATTVSIGAVAAQNSRWRVRNPVGSNLLVVMEVLAAVVTDAADALIVANSISNTADLANIQNPGQIDGRSRPNASLIASFGNSATGITGQRNIAVRQNTNANFTIDFILFEDQELTVTPGMSLELFANNQNIPMTVTAMWRERFLEDSERA